MCACRQHSYSSLSQPLRHTLHATVTKMTNHSSLFQHRRCSPLLLLAVASCALLACTHLHPALAQQTIPQELEDFALATSAQRLRMLDSQTGAPPRELALRYARQCQLLQMEGSPSAECTKRVNALAKELSSDRRMLTDDERSFLHRHALLQLDSKDVSEQQAGLRSLRTDLAPQEIFVRDPSAEGGGGDEEATTREVYPSRLDESLLEPERILAPLLSGETHLSMASPAAFEYISRQPLSREHLSAFLSLIQSPVQVSNIVQLLARDLKEPRAWGGQHGGPQDGQQQLRYVMFGEDDRPVHRLLSVEQLESLAQMVPSLAQGVATQYTGAAGGETRLYRHTAFLETLLLKRRPFSDVARWMAEEVPPEAGVTSDAEAETHVKAALEEKRAYLDSLLSFASALPPAANGLKALVEFHVLFYSARFFREFDFERWHSFLALPRASYDGVVRPSPALSTPDSPEARMAFQPFMQMGASTWPGTGAHVFTHWSPGNELDLLRRMLRAYYSSPKAPANGALGSFWTDVLEERLLDVQHAKSRLSTAASKGGPDASERTVLVDTLTRLEGSHRVQQLRDQITLRFGSDRVAAPNPSRALRMHEPASLRLQVKNVPRLHVALFELNTEQLYSSSSALQGQEPDGANIALEGLVATHSFGVDVPECDDPFARVERVISLPQISLDTRSVWVAEVRGSGLRVRAVLRRGSLTAVTTPTAAGVLVRVLDGETGERVTKASVSFGQNEYGADETTGLILLPYAAPAGDAATPFSPQASRNNLVLHDHSSPGGFSSLFPYTHLPEVYSFSALLHVAEESLLPGLRAPLLIRPVLSIHGVALSAAKLLRNLVLRIKTWDQDGVASQQVVDSLSFSDDAETVHNFLVPPGLRRIKFTLQGEVRVRANGGVQPLVAEKEYNLEGSNPGAIESLHLHWAAADAPTAAAASGSSSSRGHYTLLMLGRTGEPLAGRSVAITLQHAWRLDAPVAELPLQTDEAGRIDLGELQGVTLISVRSLDSQFGGSSAAAARSWQLLPGGGVAGAAEPSMPSMSSSSSAALLRSSFTVREGEDFILPLAATAIDTQEKKSVSDLVELMQNVASETDAPIFIKSLAQKHVKIEGTVLRVHGLARGRYTVFLRTVPSASTASGLAEMQLRVAGGRRVMSDVVLDGAAGALVQVETSKNRARGSLAITSVHLGTASTSAAGAKERAEHAAAEPTLVIRLTGVQPSTRVHVIGTHFASAWTSLASSMQGAFSSLASAHTPRVQPFALPTCSYLSPVTLGDEHQYILDRANAGSRVGNMLPRPSLLLHPAVRRTADEFTEEPTLAEAEAFRPQPPPMPQAMMRGAAMKFGAVGAAPRHREMRSKRMASSAGAPEMMMADTSSWGGGEDAYKQGFPSSEHSSMDFLRSPARLLANLRPVENVGASAAAKEPASQPTFSLRIPLRELDTAHTHVQIVAVDSEGSVALRNFALPERTKALVRQINTLADESTVAGDEAQVAASIPPLRSLSPAYRDLRLPQSLPASSHFADAHLVSTLTAGEELRIEDWTSAAVQIYATQAEAFTLLSSLASSNSPIGLSHAAESEEETLQQNFQEFSPLSRWPLLSRAEQLSFYSAHGCHETHVFLWMKARPFFNEVVLPVLRAKVQPQLIDRLLMAESNDEDLSALARPSRLETMNTLEQILLALKLMESDAGARREANAALAHSLLQRIRLEAAAQPPMDEDSRVRLFHRALRSNVLSSIISGSAATDDVASPVEPQMARTAALNFAGDAGGAMAFRTESAPMAFRGAESAAAMAMDASFDSDNDFITAAANKRQKQEWVAVPTTKEFEERGYWQNADEHEQRMYAYDTSRVPPSQQLVRVNAFWAELAAHLQRQASSLHPRAFLSSHLAQASSSLAEVVGALAFLDLPFAVEQPAEWRMEETPHGTTATLRAQDPLIVYHKELRVIAPTGASTTDAKGVTAQAPTVTLSVQYLDTAASSPGSRYSGSSVDETEEQYVRAEFLPHRAYTARVVLSNAGSSSTNIALLLQLPQGALPLADVGLWPAGGGGEAAWTGGARTEFVRLAPFASRAVSYRFYFSAVGSYSHYPAQASAHGMFVASSAPRPPLQVVRELPASSIDRTAWRWIAQRGTGANVLAHLRNANLLALDLAPALWRLSEASAAKGASLFRALVSLYRERMVYHAELFGFVLKFAGTASSGAALSDETDRFALSELIAHSGLLQQSLRPYFHSTLAHVDAADESGGYTHLEYSPLILPRAHTLDARSVRGQVVISNAALATQYRSLLEYLSARVSGSERMADDELLALCYYLLLQERVDEARDKFLIVQARVEQRTENTAAVVQGGARRKASDSRVSASLAVSSSRPALRAAWVLDHLTCFFAFYSNPAESLPIARRYLNHPLPRVRDMFAEVLRQVQEIQAEGGADADTMPEGDTIDASADEDADAAGDLTDSSRGDALRSRALMLASSAAPQLSFTFASPLTLEVRARNIAAVQVSLYEVDTELLFSMHPFAQDAAEAADASSGLSAKASPSPSSASPPLSETLRLVAPSFRLPVIPVPPPAQPKNGRAAPPSSAPSSFLVQLPAERMQRDCWVEVRSVPDSAGVSPSSAGERVLSVLRPRYSPSLLLELSPATGILQARHADTGRALPGAYVKVYARKHDGSLSFFKDGYTDWRGRWDYASLSTDQLASVSRLSVLLLHPELGAVVRQTEPPSERYR